MRKSNLTERAITRPVPKYVRQDVTLEGAKCYTSCSMKTVEHLKILCISIGNPLVAHEMDIFKLTKGCLMSEKIEPK